MTFIDPITDMGTPQCTECNAAKVDLSDHLAIDPDHQ
jgi:hypothetical protein